MADKFRKVFPIKVQFAKGEQPSATKLSAIANQSRNGLNLIEEAIGDPWNQAGDSIYTNTPLQIANLARQLGQTEIMAPSMGLVEEAFYWSEDLGARWEGYNNGFLQFKPDTPSSNLTVDSAPATRMDVFTASGHNVTASGEYFVDANTGRFRLFETINSSPHTVTYKVDPASLFLAQRRNTFGVIPDPRQAEFTGCRIEYDSGQDRYFLHLPPRRPFIFDPGETPDWYPAQSTWLDNSATDSGANKKLWQTASGTADAYSDAYWRYQLPHELGDAWSSIALGGRLPDGVLYLWDTTSNTILEDVVFRRPAAPHTGETYILQIESATYESDFSTAATVTDKVEDYDASQYVLITAGAQVSDSMRSQHVHSEQHKHNNAGDMSAKISHEDLTDLDPPTNTTQSTHYGMYPDNLSEWTKSRWENDGHVQYLNRGGSQDVTYRRDLNDNAMLGDLLLASTVGVAGVFLNTTSDSNRIYFGSRDTGPFIYLNSTTGDITASGIGNNNGFRSLGAGTGAGFYAQGGSNIASRTSHGAIFIAGVTTHSDGIQSFGNYEGRGGYFVGGSSDSFGITASGGGNNGGGGEGIGNGTGPGLQGTATGTGAGISGAGAGSNHIANAGQGGKFIGDINDGIGVHARGGATNGIAVLGEGTGTGSAIYGDTTLTEGYAVFAKGDETNPPVRAALRIFSQAADPTTVDKGAIYTHSDTGRLSISNGTGFERVINQIAHSGMDISVDRRINDGYFYTTVVIPGSTLRGGSTIHIVAALTCQTQDTSIELSISVENTPHFTLVCSPLTDDDIVIEAHLRINDLGSGNYSIHSMGTGLSGQTATGTYAHANCFYDNTSRLFSSDLNILINLNGVGSEVIDLRQLYVTVT